MIALQAPFTTAAPISRLRRVGLRKTKPFSRAAVFSTFIVDYLPGGLAILHRSPTAGYVLVHVLSGAIRAQAWEAGMGTYRSGQTWVEPAFANVITTKNASAVEPAHTLVVLITKETGSPEHANE